MELLSKGLSVIFFLLNLALNISLSSLVIYNIELRFHKIQFTSHLLIYRRITIYDIMIAFILGCETKMVTSQLLRAREGCDAYCFSIRTIGHFNCGIHGNRSCKIQLTIDYSLLHLTI